MKPSYNGVCALEGERFDAQGDECMGRTGLNAVVRDGVLLLLLENRCTHARARACRCVTIASGPLVLRNTRELLDAEQGSMQARPAPPPPLILPPL